MAGAPHRSWVFTWNNYPPNAYDTLSALRDRFHACFVGREVGASGTPHLQGVLICKSPVRFGSLQRLLPGVHIEVMRGPERDAVEYTHKDDDKGYGPRLDWDDRAQGSRTDLAAVTAIVQANPRHAIRAVAAQLPAAFVKYHQGVRALASALQPVPPLIGALPDVFWYYGPTGCGKSHTAITEALRRAGGDESNVFRWTIPNVKFPGNFNGEEYVVIDELRSTWEHFTFGRLLSLLDRFRCETELKGGQIWWQPKAIWVTTPLHPQDFVTDEERRGNPDCISQLLRRIRTGPDQPDRPSGIRLFDQRYSAVPAPPPPPADDHICADSADEGQPRPFTPPLPRRIPTERGQDSDDDFRLRLQRIGAMRQPHAVDSDDSDLEVIGFPASE